MKDLSIQHFTAKDLETEISLLIDSFSSKFTFRQKLSKIEIQNLLTQVWHVHANDPSYLHLVAKLENQLVGVILVRLAQTLHPYSIPFIQLVKTYGLFSIVRFIGQLVAIDTFSPSGCYIEHLAVADSMRGLGIGQKLILESEKYLKELGHTSISLTVEQKNPAIHLYERNHFYTVKDFKSNFTGLFLGIRHWKIMRKTL